MFGAGRSSGDRLATPRIGGWQFLTPNQSFWRAQQLGRMGAMAATAVTGAHAPARMIRKHPTGAASMEQLEPDGTLYRSVMGNWGRVTRAGRR